MAIKYSEDESLNFLKGEVERLKFCIKDVTKRGMEAIHEYDRENGVDVARALMIYNKDLEYFQNRVKEREEQIKSSSSNSIKTGVELSPVLTQKGGEVFAGNAKPQVA